MARVKRGPTQRRKHKRLLKEAKGYTGRRKNVYRLAKEAVWHAGQRAWEHRRKKKGDFRRLWQMQINAAARQHGLSYSKFMYGLRQASIELNRKMLADLANNQPKIFETIVEKAKKALSN